MLTCAGALATRRTPQQCESRPRIGENFPRARARARTRGDSGCPFFTTLLFFVFSFQSSFNLPCPLPLSLRREKKSAPLPARHAAPQYLSPSSGNAAERARARPHTHTHMCAYALYPARFPFTSVSSVLVAKKEHRLASRRRRLLLLHPSQGGAARRRGSEEKPGERSCGLPLSLPPRAVPYTRLRG